MKRSEINAVLRDGEAFIRTHGFHLPPFARWTPEDWASRGEENAEIVARGLGWDVTDFGLGDFARRGLLLFTVRNGDPRDLERGRGKLYAEKLLVVRAGQVTPWHFHHVKTEDIINRGGAPLLVQLAWATADDRLADEPVEVVADGERVRVEARGTIALEPGESVTLTPRLYHQFWSEDGDTLAGEVSTVNDDAADNRFLDPIGRFPDVEEDEAPWRLLTIDHARLAGARGA